MKNYLNLSIGAKTRLALLRESAKNGKWVSPMTWRQVRCAKLNDSAAIGQGMHDNKPIWYVNPSKNGYFARESFSSDTLKSRHTGYYTDPDCDETARGIYVALPHGRFIAGYHWSGNDERVYFPTIYDDADDAARAGDSEAETFADRERDYQTTWREARDVEDATEDAFKRLRECVALRNRACMDYVRDEIHVLCETIRTNRARLAGEFSDYA